MSQKIDQNIRIRTKQNIAVLSLLFLFISTLFPQSIAQAAPLPLAMLRLNRLAPNAPLSGIICATPSSAAAGTEGRIAVTFPSDFSLSTLSSNWTTGASGLPSGATPWPGIGATAQGISGSTVTFTGNDLGSGTANYCFTFEGASSSTGNTGSKTGVITTQTGGGSVIDTKSYGMSITKDGVGVSATMPANPTDFIAILTQITSGSLFPEDKEIEYELNYASLLSYGTDVTLEATWSLGTVAGSGVPSVEVLNYVSGSAEKAQGNISPVVDISNRKITWTIPFLPGNTNKSVHFRMKTNNSYTGASPVTFAVSGRVLGPGIATSYSTVQSTYQYKYSEPSTPGPTSTPGAGITTTPPVPSQTPTTPLVIENVEIRTVNASGSAITVQTSLPTALSVSYGTSPASLAQRLTALNYSEIQTLNFTNLEADTAYYFRVMATDQTGRVVASDIYTFTTATSTYLPTITKNSFIVTSERNLIYTFNDTNSFLGKNFIILPPDSLFEIQFAFQNSNEIRQVQLLMRNRNVLGVNNFIQQVEAAENQIPMLEIKPGVYTGRLESKTAPGYYELFAKVHDVNGNIAEEKLSDVKISKPFVIREEGTKGAVENARIWLSLYNERQRMYQTISEQILPIENPTYSRPDGGVAIVLPPGKYRAEVDALGYEKKTVDFTIGVNPDEDYPQISLKKEPFSLIYGAKYMLFVASELGFSLDEYVHTIGTSKRVYHFTVFVVMLAFLFLTVLAFSEKVHVKMVHLPRYFLSLLKLSKSDSEKDSAYLGIITDGHSKKPIPGVHIFVSDVDSGKILFHIKSNAVGKFRLVLPTKYVYLLSLEKVGYHSTMLHLHHLRPNEEQQLAMLENTEALSPHEVTKRMIRAILGLSFEVMLLLSIGATLLLIFTIGFLPVIPFLALSIFNLVFWGLHEVHMRM